MEIVIQPDPESASQLAAEIVARLVRTRPEAVLGLATGSTPLGLYQELIRLHRDEGLDFASVTTFNLDEYIGLDAEHPCSYNRFMWDHLFRHVNVDPGRVHIPDGTVADVDTYCREYEERIRSTGGIDLQVLGIGQNGHIGFNEPSSSLASRTRLKALSPQTIRDNSRFFQDEKEVPRHCITMGVGTILSSRHCLLLAFGQQKAAAAAAAVEGPVTAFVPASALQLHEKVTAILDEPAASGLQHADYYRWAYENKPAWQRT